MCFYEYVKEKTSHNNCSFVCLWHGCAWLWSVVPVLLQFCCSASIFPALVSLLFFCLLPAAHKPNSTGGAAWHRSSGSSPHHYDSQDKSKALWKFSFFKYKKKTTTHHYYSCQNIRHSCLRVQNLSTQKLSKKKKRKRNEWKYWNWLQRRHFMTVITMIKLTNVFIGNSYESVT